METLPRSHARFRQEQQPGTWRLALQTASPAVVQIRCPRCRKHGNLKQSTRYAGRLGHDIAPDGTVSPSIVCPHDCGWHIFGRLLGWEASEAQ